MVAAMSQPPSSGPRVFSIEEANALVPHLNDLVQQQLERSDAIEERLTELFEVTQNERQPTAVLEGGAVVDVTIRDNDNAAVRRLKEELRELVERYRSGWSSVEALGAVVKDPTTGLLDLYGRIDSRLVWLCWRYGEDSIEFYHELHSGFAGRKPLAEVRERMLN